MEEISGKELIIAISCFYERMTRKSDYLAYCVPFTIFSCRNTPNIRLCDYIERIYHRTMCSSSCLIQAIIYIDRLTQSTHLTIISQNVHKLLLTAIMLASKFSDDTFCSNSFFAECGLVTLDEINEMEEIFLQAIHFSLFIDERLYQKYYIGFYNHIRFSNCPYCHIDITSTLSYLHNNYYLMEHNMIHNSYHCDSSVLPFVIATNQNMDLYEPVESNDLYSCVESDEMNDGFIHSYSTNMNSQLLKRSHSNDIGYQAQQKHDSLHNINMNVNNQLQYHNSWY